MRILIHNTIVDAQNETSVGMYLSNAGIEGELIWYFHTMTSNIAAVPIIYLNIQ